jgi:hypothetical protein
MKRRDQILVVVLAIQVILSVVVFWPNPSVTAGGEPLFPDLKPDDIVALTIMDDQGNRVALQKTDGDWIVADTGGYPAAENKITPTLEKIAALNTGRLVTRTDASHQRLQVAADNFLRRLDFETTDGAGYTIYLGSAPHYAATHFRLHGQDETYWTSELATYATNATADRWIDTIYFSLDEDDLIQVTLENAHGAYEFTHAEDRKWTLVGLTAEEQLAQTKVNAVIEKAARVNLVKPLGKEEDASYGLDDPTAVITMETITQTVTLKVGAKNPSSRYFVKISESPYYVLVAEHNVKAFIENTRDNFLQLPPTPTPEGESSLP